MPLLVTLLNLWPASSRPGQCILFLESTAWLRLLHGRGNRNPSFPSWRSHIIQQISTFDWTVSRLRGDPAPLIWTLGTVVLG
jgi:hypothetical protein